MSVFRGISIVAIMGALLVLYRVHPVVGWATLATLAGGVVVVGHRRKTQAEVGR